MSTSRRSFCLVKTIRGSSRQGPGAVLAWSEWPRSLRTKTSAKVNIPSLQGGLLSGPYLPAGLQETVGTFLMTSLTRMKYRISK